VDKLKELYESALAPDYIVGLAVATRPDCVSDDVVSLLSQLSKYKYVSVELGLQTANDKTAEKMNRGYKTAVYFEAVKKLKSAGINVVTHIIIGLPGENGEDAVLTTRAAVNAKTDGVKFHLLHVLRGTPLEKEYEKGAFSCLTLEEYGAILKSCISELPENTVVHRITGDGKKSDLIAPLWSADKKKTLNYLNRILKA
jgi:radical SAM protein (TIGR01212 family)